MKTSDLKLSFQKMLDQMQKNLVEVQARIGELKKDLSTAEAEYKGQLSSRLPASPIMDVSRVFAGLGY